MYKSAGSHHRCGTRDGQPSPLLAGGRAIQAAMARRWQSAAASLLSADSCHSGRSGTDAANP